MSNDTTNIRKKFKKLDGTYIDDIIMYLREKIETDPYLTISVGCDSIQKKRKTIYAITLMIYNTDIKNGAHILFFRENLSKIRNNNERLQKEAQYVHDVSEFLCSELESFYERKDLTNIERKRYKFHLAKCNGEYQNDNYDNSVVQGVLLTDSEQGQLYQLVDIHLDFNPMEGKNDNKGYARNKSYASYKAYVPWLRGMGYRVWAKPLSHASSSAADLLLKEKNNHI